MKDRLIEAIGANGELVGWCAIPRNWQYTDEQILNWYKIQIEREKGVEVEVRIKEGEDAWVELISMWC